jgi:hypothetical protein
MSGTRRQELIYALGLGAVVALIIGVCTHSQGTVGFCRQTFQELAQGRMAVAKKIHWGQFHAAGIDVGVAYQQVATEHNRVAYRRLFIQQFAQYFQQAGGRLEQFAHWRIAGERNGYVIVAADDTAHKKTLLFAVPAHGQKQLDAIYWWTS